MVIVLVALGKSAIDECIQMWFSEILSMEHNRKGRERSPLFLLPAVSEASQISKPKIQLLGEFLAVLATTVAVARMSGDEEMAEGSAIHFSPSSASISKRGNYGVRIICMVAREDVGDDRQVIKATKRMYAW